jgi:hypothetical protein
MRSVRSLVALALAGATFLAVAVVGPSFAGAAPKPRLNVLVDDVRRLVAVTTFF